MRQDKKHIAQTGAQAGQWVHCGAKNCRNGGLHINDNTLKTIRMWKTETAESKVVTLKEITLTDAEEFLALPDEIQTELKQAYFDDVKNKIDQVKAEEKAKWELVNRIAVTKIYNQPTKEAYDYLFKNAEAVLMQKNKTLMGVLSGMGFIVALKNTNVAGANKQWKKEILDIIATKEEEITEANLQDRLRLLNQTAGYKQDVARNLELGTTKIKEFILKPEEQKIEVAAEDRTQNNKFKRWVNAFMSPSK